MSCFQQPITTLPAARTANHLLRDGQNDCLQAEASRSVRIPGIMVRLVFRPHIEAKKSEIVGKGTFCEVEKLKVVSSINVYCVAVCFRQSAMCWYMSAHAS